MDGERMTVFGRMVTIYSMKKIWKRRKIREILSRRGERGKIHEGLKTET